MAKRTLNPAQELALRKVREKNAAKRRVRAEAELEVRRTVAERIAAAELEEAIAVREADQLEVPRRRIHTEGLLTSDRHTLDRILAKTERTAEVRITTGPFRWLDGKRVRVEYPAFPTTLTGAEDYPEVLSGIVTPDHNAPNGWRVLEDDSDQETEFGVLPGLLHQEVEDVPRTRPDSLTGMLDAWAEAGE